MKDITKVLFFSFLFLLILSIGCQEQPDLEKIKADVNSLNDQMTKAILEGDHQTTLNMFTEDAISLPSYEPMIKGLTAIKEHSEKQREMPMNMKAFTLTSTDVWVSGKFVVDIGTYSLTMEMPEMPGGEFMDHGKYLTLFEIQTDGSLKMKAETWNTDTNPWEMMMEHAEGTDEVSEN